MELYSVHKKINFGFTGILDTLVDIRYVDYVPSPKNYKLC